MKISSNLKCTITAFLFLAILFQSCDDNDPDEMVVYDNTPFILEHGNLPAPNLPQDNPLTIQGVLLGRMLFYEPLLSKDGSQSCASCHHQPDGFSDSLIFSIGVEGLPGKRQAMPIFNMAWHNNAFFWDGRAPLLRDQSLRPIQDPLEMNETLPNVVNKLSQQSKYKDQFIRAFGTDEINPERMSLAMEQFMLTIVSADSRFDKFLNGTATLSQSEQRGRALFMAEYNPFFPGISGADCMHCHGGANFENDQYMNNGLDGDADMTDIGREAVTNLPGDRGKFKVPSLRNIAVTAPYMHDGRFQTLEEVIDHYNSGIHESTTVDPALLNTKATGLMLSDDEKRDLINFLKTLTDQTFLQNDEYKTPF